MTTDPKNLSHDDYWENVKNMAITGFSVMIGDPEAIKALVDIVANATYKGLEHLNLKDEEKEDIKKKIEESVNSGADGIIGVLSKFQEKSGESSRELRAKYGRKAKFQDPDQVN